MIHSYEVEITEDVIWNINDRDYIKGERFVVVDIFPEKKYYIRYYKDTLDWIPKQCVIIIKQVIDETL